MNFMPMSPIRVKHYLDRLHYALATVPNASTAVVELFQATADRQNPAEIQEQPLRFWTHVKAGIEYVIDLIAVDTPVVDRDEDELSDAYTDLHRLIDWVEVVHGIRWVPELTTADDE